MSEETRKEMAPTLSPWDMVLWKLDSLDKRVEAMDQGLNRRIDRLEERIDHLEQRVDREVGGLRGGPSDLRREARSTRASFTILEFTAVLGFLAVLVSIWIR